MKLNFRHITIFFIVNLGILACVDDYKVSINTSKGYFLIDGAITDLDEPQYLTISRTLENAEFESSEFTSTIVPKQKTFYAVTAADVKLVVNGTERIQFKEAENGNYELPLNFRAKVGNTYQLVVQTEDGKHFESTPEKMLPVPKITNVYDQFNTKGIRKPNTTNDEKIATSDIYIDFQDTPSQQNFYSWRWVDYEIQTICETCQQGVYNYYETDNGTTGDCFRDLTLNYNEIFDYTCDTRCWDLFRSSEINILSDLFFDGQPQTGKLIAQIPLFQSNATLVSIQQMSLTPNAYRYFKLIQDQAVNTGTLADTPPAPIKGNLTVTTNSSELVLGYFTVSSVAEVRYSLSRKNTRLGGYNGLFKTIHNRFPYYEPISNERPFIPLAFCKNSRNRTNIVPKGWL